MPLLMAKPKKRVKKIKKHWLRVYASKHFDNVFLGEVYGSNPEAVLNRPLFTNLSLLTNNYNHQHTNLVFQITNVSGEKLVAHLKRYELQQAFIKRLVRRRRSKIDDSFIVAFKDQYAVVKPLIITASKTSKAINTSLRKFLRQHIASIASGKLFEEFVVDVIKTRLLLDLKKQMNKIHPIANLELRVLETIPREKVSVKRLVKPVQQERFLKHKKQLRMRNQLQRQPQKLQSKEQGQDKSQSKVQGKEQGKDQSQGETSTETSAQDQVKNQNVSNTVQV